MSLSGSLFGLPASFFASATATGSRAVPEQHVEPSATSRPASANVPDGSSADETSKGSWNDAGATCVACGIGASLPPFASLAEQREHFKTDWHRFNLKRRLQKQLPLTEEDFERLIDQDDGVSSISGSGSSDSEDDAGTTTQRKGGRQATSAPQTVFVSDGTLFAVWRCLLAQDHVKPIPPPEEQLAALQQLRATGGLWVVLLLRGGHFAGAVFRVHPRAAAAAVPAPKPAEAGGGGRGAALKQELEGSYDVVAHKTFHRYVVRAKAGGKQSSKDATGKFARSAGSRLRRYNEQALERDIHDLLTEWRGHLQAASLVFIQAPSSNARTLLPPVNPPIAPSDPRLRRVPFVTQRPTHSETKRVLRVLTSVYSAELPPEGKDDAASAEVPQASPSSQDAGGQVAAQGHSGSQQPVEERDAGQASTSSREDTPLHRAAKAGDAELVAALLAGGADPAAPDWRDRPPYLLAASKEVRDAFRRAMAREPDRWDWEAAAVPSPLTEELEAAQAAKRDAKKARLKAKQREQKEKEKKKGAPAAGAAGADGGASTSAGGLADDEEDEIAKALREAAAITAKAEASRQAGKHRAGRGGGGRGGGAAGRQSAAAPPPSAEEMARRRERLAAAAEARQQALQAAAGQQRLW